MNLLSFFSENLGSIAVLAVLFAVIVLIVVGIVKNKKRGGCSCGNSCSSCPMNGKCHEGKSTDQK